MASFLDLLKGTQKVIKTTVDNASKQTFLLRQINFVTMKGTMIKHFNGAVSSASEPGKNYKCWLIFSGLKTPDEAPSVSSNQVFCRCDCQSFYFWASFANKKNKALAGNPFKPYKRKTPAPPVGRDYKNPYNIPCVCKHIIFMVNRLIKMKKLK